MTDADRPDFPRPLSVDSLPARGIERSIEASPHERLSLARRFGLEDLESLKATLSVSPRHGGIFEVAGHLSADVVQTCVVTLEPIQNHVEEDFSALFSYESRGTALEVDLDMMEEDPPEPIVNGVIDLGELTAQYLSLALDPYPRSPDVSVGGVDEQTSGNRKADGPFAALSKLKPSA